METDTEEADISDDLPDSDRRTDDGVASSQSGSVVLRALWRMLRPNQVALIFSLYAVGCLAAVVTAETVPTESQLVGGALALAATTATVHYANEYADYETDAIATGSEFSGGSGALHDYGLPRSLARRAAAVTGVATLPAGVVAWLLGVPPRALAVLGAILLLGWEYSLPPLSLAWRGLGAVTNALVGALLLPVYAVAVVTPPTLAHVGLFVPFTVITALSLLMTQWPDRDGDAVVGKRTLATRVSPRRLRQVFFLVVAVYLVSVVVLAVTVTPPLTVLAAHVVPLPTLAWAIQTFTRRESPLPGVASMGSLAAALFVAWTVELGVV